MKKYNNFLQMWKNIFFFKQNNSKLFLDENVISYSQKIARLLRS